jgi:hypothetical protein
MPLKTIFAVELLCLVMDVLVFHAAFLHLTFVVVLGVTTILDLIRRKKRVLIEVLAIPAVAILSMSGYLVDWHLKAIVNADGPSCFPDGKCNMPDEFLGYRVKQVF